ncbi:MAG: PDDEXK nuclease domain-containing protein [Tenericutes bacterium]|nr:PDDEXK nuclease domain-containing protein [Mycoplasmatota bacterium]
MNYYNEIKDKLIENEIYAKVKDYSKEKHRVITYFEIGKLLYEAGSKYGDNIIGKYAEKLTIEIGKKYNTRTLRSMRQLYFSFKDDIWKPLVSKLSWTNLLLIMPLKDKNKMNYYINQCLIYNLSKRQLQEKIKNNEYDRLNKKTKDKLILNNNLDIVEYIPNPIIIKNKENVEIITEKVLHNLIIENLPSFMKELGTGYSFIDNEYKIKIGQRYNYIDLLLFNYEFNCFVVIELKVTELKKQYIGQIQIYMDYIDKNIRKSYHDKTIGIIICKRNNEYIIEYCSNKKIISREYKII